MIGLLGSATHSRDQPPALSELVATLQECFLCHITQIGGYPYMWHFIARTQMQSLSVGSSLDIELF